MPPALQKNDAGRRALRSALLYALFGGLWIVFSDRTLEILVQDPAALTRLQTYKGWFFVGVTAILVWWFVRTHLLDAASVDAQLLQQAGRLRQARDERDALLRECNSRIVSNLQVMVGLLNLARDRVESPAAVPALDAAIARVYGMVLIHAQLHDGLRLDRVDMAWFIRELHAYLAGRYGGQRVEAVFDLDEAVLHIERAIPCAMLLVEALTNVFSHAFAPEAKGRVTVRLKGLGGSRLLLAVEDNGRGLDPARSEGLGLGLIRSLAGQLRGDLSIASDQGVIIRVEFSGGPPSPDP